MLSPAISWAQAIGARNSIVVEPDLDRDDVAGSRKEPAYQPQPTLIGPVYVQPSLSVVAGYNTNVFNRPDERKAASVFVTPALDLRANLARHDLRLSAVGNIRRFEKYTTENSEEFALVGRGRYDLGEKDAITTLAEYSHRIEPRSSAGSVPDAAEPVSYARLVGELGTTFRWGAVRLAPSAHYDRIRYNAVAVTDGSEVDQSFRDTRSLRGGVRIDYNVSGLVSAFVSGSYDDMKSPSAPLERKRDARTATFTAGIRGEISPVISGEIGIGYQSRNYAQPDYQDIQGLTYRADVQWYVTPLVTLRAEAARAFRNSGIRQVGGILTDDVALTAYYDPLRNLRLSLSASAEFADYREVDARTWRGGMRFQAQYRMSPAISIGGYAAIEKQDVDGFQVANQFTSATVGIGITVTP
jgi:Uncharacterized protein conserved in bacteria (DUF2320).